MAISAVSMGLFEFSYAIGCGFYGCKDDNSQGWVIFKFAYNIDMWNIVGTDSYPQCVFERNNRKQIMYTMFVPL